MTDKEFAEQIAQYSLPTIAEGLLNLETMRKRAKEKPPMKRALSPDELTDKERREEFGRRIKMMRTLLGMTQLDLAKKLGVTTQAITTYEKGKREPGFRNLIGLSQALGVSVDWLIGNEPPPANQTADK